MRLSELSGHWRHELLQESCLWCRQIETITGLDLKMFLRQYWQTEVYNRAVSEVNDMIGAVWDALLSGELSEAPRLVYFETPSPRLCVDEFRQWLSEVSIERRKAILFSLETGCSIAETINLTYRNLSSVRLTAFALEIVRSSVRYLRSNYVFLEKSAVTDALTPLYGLNDSVLDVSQGMGFDALVRLYKTMLPIDRTDDLTQFERLIYS